MIRRGATRGAVGLVLFGCHSQIISRHTFPVGYRSGTKGVRQGHSNIATPVATSHSDQAM